MITSVDFWSRARAEAFLFAPYHALVSITDPDQPLAYLHGTRDILRLAFHDIEAPIAHPKFQPEFLFSTLQATKLTTYVQGLHQDPDPRQIIVHCEAGVSRSAAIALYIAELTQCEFLRRDQACFANKWVIAQLETPALPLCIPDVSTSKVTSLFE